MTKRFTRSIENFTCDHCGTFVQGDGYTNHCPSCLWSKHVDIDPGDRASQCRGMMEPIGVDMKKGRYMTVCRCLKCGTIKRNKMADKDSMSELIKIMQRQSENE